MHFLSVRGQFVYLMSHFPLTIIVGNNAWDKLLKHHKMLFIMSRQYVSNDKPFCLVYEVSFLNSLQTFAGQTMHYHYSLEST